MGAGVGVERGFELPASHTFLSQFPLHSPVGFRLFALFFDCEMFCNAAYFLPPPLHLPPHYLPGSRPPLPLPPPPPTDNYIDAYITFGCRWDCPHYAGIILSITVRKKNRALCWNNSAKFLLLFVLYKNFAKTMGFPQKTPAQVPHFLTRSGYKNMAFSSSSSTTLSAASSDCFHLHL